MRPRTSFSPPWHSLTAQQRNSATAQQRNSATAQQRNSAAAQQRNSAADTGWPAYGGDAGGSRYSASTQITRDNLIHLHPVWTFHTHALDTTYTDSEDASFESTPILAQPASRPTIYVTSPFDVVFALDPTSGHQFWTYDPKVVHLPPGNLVTSRGVAFWAAPSPLRAQLDRCQDRIFLGTTDGRLISLDAATGGPCTSFGASGQIDLKQNVHLSSIYGETSPPAVIGNTVVVGSVINDNQRVDSESGVVRAYDAITGKLLWSWEPIPWAAKQPLRTGAANTWSVISADPTLNLVYLPTGSAAPDYYGGLRPGDDRDADSVVALNASTGQKVWAFQAVHHDLWDYDIASQPLLFTFRNQIPAIAITTKMGLVFVLDRRTGQPLYPIHERTVPPSDVPGEHTSPTQPFQDIPPLSSIDFSATGPGQTFQRSPADQQACRAQLASLRNEGIYTPPSLRGSVMFPGNLGGVNWGSPALDPATGILYANTNRVAFQAHLIPRWGKVAITKDIRDTFFDWANWGIAAGSVLAAGTLLRFRRKHSIVPGPITISLTTVLMLMAIPISLHKDPPMLSHFGHDLGEEKGAPYLVQRDILTDTHHHPCNAPPWGVISAINLNTAEKLWETPLGSAVPNQHTGIANFGGPIVTASGLVFTAAAEDPFLRAFDATTGTELWNHPLPFPAQATPMTYTLDGHQFIVIAAGGHGDKSTQLGDTLVAFALTP